MVIDRKIKRPDKEKQLIEKLGQDEYNWAYNIQSKPFPSWIEAFDYAYQLGYTRGITKEVLSEHGDLLKRLQD